MERIMMADVLQISKSARDLGYSEARHDAVRIIADAAEQPDLDKPTLLWVLDKINALSRGMKSEQ